MHRRLFNLALAGGFSAALPGLAPGRAVAQDAKRPARVVVQVSDPDPARWSLALNNVRNLQEDLGAANVTVEIVAYGPGIGMLRFDAPTESRIAEAQKSGVKVLACENTMRAQNLQRADMQAGIAYVPAGVTEIVRRQQEGWVYLRP